MNEFIEVRCGAYRFLVPSEDIASIEFLDERLDPVAGRRMPRPSLMLDGRALAGNCAAARVECGVALRLNSDNGGEARVIVDHAGALIHLEPETLEPLPRAVAELRAFFVGVWRDPAAHQYLFCLRPRNQLPIDRFVWRRRLRRAGLTGAADNARTM